MNDERDDPQPKQLIYEMRRRVQRARNHYWRDGVNGQVSQDTHLELAEAVVEYWDVLYEFRDESILNEGDFPDIKEVRSRLGKTTQVPQEAPGDTSNKELVEQPAVMDIPTRRLVEISKRLDDLAKQLGFGASVSEKRPIYHAGKLDPEDYDEPVKDTVARPK